MLVRLPSLLSSLFSDQLTLSSLLGLCLGLSCIQLLIVGSPCCLVIGIGLGLSRSSSLLVGVLSSPWRSSRSPSRTSVHGAWLWASKHLGSLIRTTVWVQERDRHRIHVYTVHYWVQINSLGSIAPNGAQLFRTLGVHSAIWHTWNIRVLTSVSAQVSTPLTHHFAAPATSI